MFFLTALTTIHTKFFSQLINFKFMKKGKSKSHILKKQNLCSFKPPPRKLFKLNYYNTYFSMFLVNTIKDLKCFPKKTATRFEKYSHLSSSPDIDNR